jgi:AraC family L-rhamnose operon transcriptional activator RhaR
MAEVLAWAYSPYLPDNVPHRHTYFEICQVGAYGSGYFIVEGRSHEIHPGNLFIARPGVIHQIVNTAHPNMELFWVAFLWTPASGVPNGEVDTLLDIFVKSPNLVVQDEDKRISILWQALRAVAQGSPRSGYDMQVEGLAASLLLAIAQVGAGSDLPQAEEPVGLHADAVKVRLALRYIHDNLDRRLPVPEIATQVHLSPRHLSRLFAQYVGVSPAAYVEQARLDRAKALLEHTGTPIKGIAGAVGYQNVHHFSRAFSRHVGHSPGAYREATSTMSQKAKDAADRAKDM